MLAACGDDDAAPVADAADPGFVRFAMDEVAAGSVLVAEPDDYSALCGPCPAVVPGRIGGAYHFTGALSLPLRHGELVGAAPFTVAIWIKPPAALTQPVTALAKPLDTTGSTSVLALTVDALSGRVTYAGNTGGAPDAVEASTDVRGAWHHVAATWDGSVRTLYVDGVPAGLTLRAFDDSALGLSLGAGVQAGMPALQFTGDLDELRIYPRALDGSEIDALAHP